MKEGKKLALPIQYILSVDNVAEGFSLYNPDGSEYSTRVLDVKKHFADTKIVDIAYS